MHTLSKLVVPGETFDHFNPDPFNRRFLTKLEQPDVFALEFFCVTRVEMLAGVFLGLSI